MKRQIKWLFQITSAVFVFLMAGCSPSTSFTETPTVTVRQMTLTGTPNQQDRTFTATPTERLLTATPTSSPTPTPKPATSTPLPTLSANDTKDLVLDLLKDNGDCQFPCLWGMTPGETKSQDIKAFFAQFGNIVIPEEILVDPSDFGDKGGLGLLFKVDNLEISTDFSYYEANDELKQLVLTGYATHKIGSGSDPQSEYVFGDPQFNQLFQYYMLPQILTTYGHPSKVLIKPFQDEQGHAPREWLPFSLVVIYEEQGFLVQYISPRQVIGNDFAGCPWMAQITFTTWQLGHEVSLVEILPRISGAGINELNVDYFKSIDEATSMTLDEFYETFKNPENTACLETPTDLWSQP